MTDDIHAGSPFAGGEFHSPQWLVINPSAVNRMHTSSGRSTRSHLDMTMQTLLPERVISPGNNHRHLQNLEVRSTTLPIISPSSASVRDIVHLTEVSHGQMSPPRGHVPLKASLDVNQTTTSQSTRTIEGNRANAITTSSAPSTRSPGQRA